MESYIMIRVGLVQLRKFVTEASEHLDIGLTLLGDINPAHQLCVMLDGEKITRPGKASPSEVHHDVLQWTKGYSNCSGQEPLKPQPNLSKLQRQVLETLQWMGLDTEEDCLADEMSLTPGVLRSLVNALIDKGLVTEDTLPESFGEPRMLTVV